MAKHAATGPAETGAPTDYDEHARTYTGFVAFTGLAAITTINILITLVIFAFGSDGSFWIGMATLFLTIAAATIGIIFKGSWKYSGAVAALAVLAVILTVA